MTPETFKTFTRLEDALRKIDCLALVVRRVGSQMENDREAFEYLGEQLGEHHDEARAAFDELWAANGGVQ
jgi:hypothetical protein